MCVLSRLSDRICTSHSLIHGQKRRMCESSATYYGESDREFGAYSHEWGCSYLGSLPHSCLVHFTVFYLDSHHHPYISRTRGGSSSVTHVQQASRVVQMMYHRVFAFYSRSFLLSDLRNPTRASESHTPRQNHRM